MRHATLQIAPEGPLTYRAVGGVHFEKGRVYPLSGPEARPFDGHPDFVVTWYEDPPPPDLEKNRKDIREQGAAGKPAPSAEASVAGVDRPPDDADDASAAKSSGGKGADKVPKVAAKFTKPRPAKKEG